MNHIKGKRKPGVKIPLTNFREACSDHLAAFEGIGGYTQGLKYYPGTIFRFPLRSSGVKSPLKPSGSHLTALDINRLMKLYFDEARISLLFLRQIRSIGFSIYGKSKPSWTVSRRPPLDEDAKSFSELVICDFVRNDLDPPRDGKDKWWVAIEDLQPEVDRLPEISRRVMKNVECGIAALISSTSNNHNPEIKIPNARQSSFFNVLPLPLLSALPVHLHASFMLSGDRQSIAIDEDGAGAKSNGSSWNRYLLQEAFPKLYLSFLDDIQNQVQNVFSFWPQEPPPKGSCSELLYAEFWKEVPKSSQRLYPRARQVLKVGQRTPAKKFDLEQAVFDFLPKADSDALATLLLSMNVNLVREVPVGIIKHLEAMPNVTSVTASMLRVLMKSEKGRFALLKEKKETPSILIVLLSQLMTPKMELADLDGCHILPLLDGSLAELKLLGEGNSNIPFYYLVTEKEWKLFEFASNSLVHSDFSAKFTQIISSNEFNLTKLHPSHVKDLLKMRPESSNPEEWLTEFWKYWNGNINAISASSSLEDVEVKIFKANFEGVDTYASPKDLYNEASVVEPTDPSHRELCSCFPGLRRFYPKSMPKSIADKEKSFRDEMSFERFLLALQKLAAFSEVGIPSFLRSHVDGAHLTVIQQSSPFF